MTTTAWPTIERGDIARRVRLDQKTGTRVFLLRGAAGIGKTTLADAVAEQLASGRDVTRLSGSPSGLWMVGGDLPRIVSFGPDAPAGSVSVAGIGAESVLVVDDAHELDAESANWLYVTLAYSDRNAVLTTRDDAALTTGLERLLVMDGSSVLDVAPLTEPETVQILSKALGQTISAKASHSVWQLSDGNPFVLRELVRTHETDLLAGEVDRLLQEKGRSPAIASLLNSQLTGLSDDARDALSVLSVPDELPLSVAHAAVGDAAIDELERAGLVTVSERNDEPAVRVRHRWCRASINNSSSPRARRSYSSLLSAAFRDELQDGIRTALDLEQFPVAVTIARAAAEHGDDWSTVALAQVLIAQRTHETLTEARAILRRLRSTVIADELAPLLMPLLAMTELLLGDRSAAEALLDGPEAHSGAADEEMLTLAQAIHELLFVSPRRAALRLADQHWTTAARLKVLAAAIAGNLTLAAGPAGDDASSTEASSLGESIESLYRHDGPAASRSPYAAMAASFDNPTISGRLGYALQAAALAQMQGHLRDATGWCTTIISSEYWSVDSLFAYGGLCECAFYMGRRDWLQEAAHQLAVRYEELGSPLLGAATHDRSEALCLSTQPGNVRRVRKLLSEGASRLHDHDYLLFEADLLLMAAKLGVADAEMAGRHASVAATIGGDVVLRQAAAIGALASNDWGGLLAACRQLETAGVVFGSVVLAAQGAGAAQKAGDPRSARQLAAHAEQLRVGTDIDASITGGASAVGTLSVREREVARLAADGLSSKEIAQRVELTRKTVDNTLQRAYRKLGVSSRADLRDLVRSDATALDA